MYSREVNGKKIAWIENNPLSLKDLTNYKKVAAYIADHIGEVYTILESGSKVYIGENLPKEYTQSEYTKALLRNNQPILRAKKKTIGSFGEMIEIATNRRWEKTKHAANKDAKYGVYRYSTAFAFPVKQNGKITSVKSFDAELVILNSSDGKKYLYDIVNIKENTADETDLMERDQRRQNAATRRGASENSIRSSSENVNEKFSLEPVKPIQPKNGEWERGSTTDEVRAKHPDLWAVDAESSESRNPTQISGTVKSYRKIYDALKAEGFNGTVLDASSGLGYGTRAGIEEYGFNVEDIEPFPDSSYRPKYTDYSKLHKKYDVIISNAVLNVLPQDQRDALVVKMGQMLNDGGRMFINVRGTDVRNASSKVPIDEANMEYYISNTGSYQKGFTKKELVAYLSDALGKDYTIVGTNKFGAVSAVVTKQAEVSKKFSREPERLNELRRHNERKLAQATAEDAANENERGLIKDYKRQYDKVSGIAEKLNTARQEVLTAERSGGGNTTAKKKIKKTPDTLSGVWQGKKASNPRPTVLETAALPAELFPYKIGGPSGTRTPDRPVMSRLL